MPQSFISNTGLYTETLTDIPTPSGWTAVPPRPGPWDTWDGTQWVSGSEPVPTPAQLDAKADATTDQMLEYDMAMKAMGMVVADIVKRVVNGDIPAGPWTDTQARTWVKNEFWTHYRALL